MNELYAGNGSRKSYEGMPLFILCPHKNNAFCILQLGVIASLIFVNMVLYFQQLCCKFDANVLLDPFRAVWIISASRISWKLFINVSSFLLGLIYWLEKIVESNLKEKTELCSKFSIRLILCLCVEMKCSLILANFQINFIFSKIKSNFGLTIKVWIS